MIKQLKHNHGFTLIEMIVSLGVFSVVVTIAVGAMLMLISTNQQLQGEQSVMTNLAFALDTMTREIRTGYNYYCVSAVNESVGGSANVFEDDNNPDTIVGVNTSDCATGRPSNSRFQGISFFEGGNSITKNVTGARRILYYFDEDENKIMRRVGNNDAQSVVSSGLVIQNAEFYVTGSSPWNSPGSNLEQPTVTIYIEAKESGDVDAKVYYLETTVTQRTLDL